VLLDEAVLHLILVIFSYSELIQFKNEESALKSDRSPKYSTVVGTWLWFGILSRKKLSGECQSTENHFQQEDGEEPSTIRALRKTLLSSWKPAEVTTAF